MILGDFELISIFENRFKIDAASMFGVIPKVIWERMVKADEFNRVNLDINPLIVKTAERVILIDTGFGDVMNDKQKMIFGVEKPTRWDEQLAKHSIKPQDISAVIFTHLHADHALGALKMGRDNIPELRFPNAKMYVQKTEWYDATHPNERTAATYHIDKLNLLDYSGKLELLDGDAELFPGINVKLLGGHTPGMQGVIIDAGGQRVIYPADIMPNTYNIRIPYVGAVDLDPTTTMNQKRWLTEKILKEDWIIAFDHDTDLKFAKFVVDVNGKLRAFKAGE